MTDEEIKITLERLDAIENSPYRIKFKGSVERDKFAIMLMENGIARSEFGIPDRSIVFFKSEVYSAALLLK